MLTHILLCQLIRCKVFLHDSFSDFDTTWVKSTWKDVNQGTFEVGPPSKNSVDGFNGIRTVGDSKFFTASRSLDKTVELDTSSKFLFQFTLKQEQSISCGGGYLKMGPEMAEQEKFGDPTQYYIMFGPDECGGNKRIHVIFHHKGKNLLKKVDILNNDMDNFSHTYRLYIDTSDGVSTVSVDGVEKYRGKMIEDWDFLPPKQIPDPTDQKPSEWVDEPDMEDESDVKPADWVDDATMPDPDASRPDDHNDEELGEWTPDQIPNPKYVGPWKAKRIPNPLYKGAWEQKMISNPEFDENDATDIPKFDQPIKWVGIDLWQVTAGSFFTDIIIADDTELADEKVTEVNKIREMEKEAEKTVTDDSGDADDDIDDEEL